MNHFLISTLDYRISTSHHDVINFYYRECTKPRNRSFFWWIEASPNWVTGFRNSEFITTTLL